MTTTQNNPEATAAQIKQKMSAGVSPEQAVTQTLDTSATNAAAGSGQATTGTAGAASGPAQNTAVTPDDL